jgi:hypothetical protein
LARLMQQRGQRAVLGGGLGHCTLLGSTHRWRELGG